MQLKALSIAVITALFINACNEKPKQESNEINTTETVKPASDEIIKTTTISKNGDELKLLFNNTKGTATANFNGETIELKAQKAASGYWYKNKNYELQGKGNNVELKKNGKVIFSHTEDVETVEYKNDAGQTLNVTYNNTTGTAKAYLNGGEQINLEAQKAVSGIWYKNDQYELSGKGKKVTLLKDGETVFKN